MPVLILRMSDDICATFMINGTYVICAIWPFYPGKDWALGQKTNIRKGRKNPGQA